MTLSPVTRRRLAIFRQHRRGYVSFWIFLVLFGASLFAEFIANDRPLLIRFDDQLVCSRAGGLQRGHVRARIHAHRGRLSPILSCNV